MKLPTVQPISSQKHRQLLTAGIWAAALIIVALSIWYFVPSKKVRAEKTLQDLEKSSLPVTATSSDRATLLETLSVPSATSGTAPMPNEGRLDRINELNNL